MIIIMRMLILIMTAFLCWKMHKNKDEDTIGSHSQGRKRNSSVREIRNSDKLRLRSWQCLQVQDKAVKAQ